MYLMCLHIYIRLFSYVSACLNRLGLGDNEGRLVPCPINMPAFMRGSGDTNCDGCAGRAVMVSCGGAHSACITVNASRARELWMWGWNRYGQLGREGGDVCVPRLVSGELLGGGEVLFVSCGQAHSAAITQVRKLWLLWV